jgi:NAD(P)-dependent dehydrogenase (short-subunit alcohol dehydrogenase family)
MSSTNNSVLSRFIGKTALVTGAGSGIGRATVYRFLKEGALVIAVDIVESGLRQTMDEASHLGYGENLRTVVCDISDESAVHTKIGAAIAEAGELHALVNAAGILRAAHTHEMTLDFWNNIIKINLTGTFLVTRECIPTLLRTEGASVVNFSSTSASFAHPYMAAYAATKGAIQSFTHAIASEYAKQGLRVTSVAPGSIESGMVHNPGFPEDADLSLIAKLTPGLGEGFGSADAAAGVVAMLASEDGNFITGTEIRIDGGTHM